MAHAAPKTPIMKRLFRDVLKPTMALGKRHRSSEQENVPQTPHKPKSNCVALQNEDEDEDAVVITALDTVPFCCHADLLVMTRPELVAAAQTLNAKLPKVLQVAVDESRSDIFIRRSIEILVGIKSDGERGLKRDRSVSLYAVDPDASVDESRTTILPPSPITPRRNRSFAISLANTPRLASLREEDEDRPLKRRRMSMDVQSPTPPARIAVLRSHSQRVSAKRPTGLHRNVTFTRGRGRPRSQSAVLTSTPKTRRLVPKAVRPPPREPLDESFGSVGTGISGSTTVEHHLDRREWVAGWLEGELETEAVKEVAEGLEGMSLQSSPSSSSDMDLSE